MSVLTPADVKPYLGMTKDASDPEVEAMIASAEAAIAHRVGPLSSMATTSVVPGSGTGALVLPVTPVVSVTSVTGKSGGTITPERTSLAAGVIYATTLFSESYYTVVYQAGRATVPDDLKLAIRELVRHLWVTQRGQGQRPGSPVEVPGAAYSFPIRVEQLLTPYQRTSV